MVFSDISPERTLYKGPLYHSIAPCLPLSGTALSLQLQNMAGHKLCTGKLFIKHWRPWVVQFLVHESIYMHFNQEEEMHGCVLFCQPMRCKCFYVCRRDSEWHVIWLNQACYCTEVSNAPVTGFIPLPHRNKMVAIYCKFLVMAF